MLKMDLIAKLILLFSIFYRSMATKHLNTTLQFLSYRNGTETTSLNVFKVNFTGNSTDISSLDIYVHLPLTSLTKRVTSIAYIANLRQTYIMDPYAGQILCIKLSQSQGIATGRVERFHRGVSPGLSQIAIDTCTNIVYWTDRYFQMIAFKPALSNISGRPDEFQILYDNLDNPEALAIDSDKRYIFWAVNGETPKIEMYTIDGNGRKLVAAMGIRRTTSLTADPSENKLYWFDSIRRQIESSNYDGLHREFVIKKEQLGSIAIVSPGILITTQQKLNEIDVTMFFEDASEEEVSVHVNQPVAVANWLPNKGLKDNICREKKCQHYCAYTVGKASCKCFDGYILHQDGVNCLGTYEYRHRGFVYARNKSICIMDITTLTGFEHNRQCFKLNLDTISHITADIKSRVIFIAARQNGGSIHKWSWTNRHLMPFMNNLGEFGGLQFNRENNTLMWTNKQKGTIVKASVITKTTETVVERLWSPVNLILDVRKSKMFWINAGTNQIFSANMDGTAVKALIVSEKPKALSFDWKSNRLYWATGHSLLSVAAEGSYSLVHNFITPLGLKFLMFYRGVTFLVKQNQVDTVILQTISTEEHKMLANLTLNEKENIVDVFIMDENVESESQGLCGLSNGGCPQICYSNNTDVGCYCYLGYTEATNGSCETVYSENAYILFDAESPISHYQYDIVTKNLLALNLSTSDKTVLDAIAFHGNRFFWIEEGDRRLFSNLMISDPLVVPEDFMPIRLAVSEYPEVVYILAVDGTKTRGIILAFSIEKQVVRSIYRGEMMSDLTVDPVSKKVYVLEKNLNDTVIVSIHLETMRNQTEVNVGKGIISAITVNYFNLRVYWAEVGSGIFSFSTDENRDIKQVVKDPTAIITDLDFYKNDIYYTAQNHKMIVKIDMSDYKKTKVISSPLFGELRSIFFFQNIVCNENITNGVLEDGCDKRPGAQCSITCLDGFQRKGMDNINCLANGSWDISTLDPCEMEYETQRQHKKEYVGIAVTIPVFTVIIITTVIIYRRKLTTLKRKVKRLKNPEGRAVDEEMREEACYTLADDVVPRDQYNLEINDILQQLKESNELIEEMDRQCSRLKHDVQKESENKIVFKTRFEEKLRHEAERKREREELLHRVVFLEKEVAQKKEQLRLYTVMAGGTNQCTRSHTSEARSNQNQTNIGKRPMHPYPKVVLARGPGEYSHVSEENKVPMPEENEALMPDENESLMPDVSRYLPQ